ncbi:plasmid pRiA4b ORF-3 family protein [Nitrosomonas ureae]|uniref:PRiA4b ORF-3-like protein n=1 Tax=Nitrosomonas ureae TaxID=44577 RepID=A0A2T5IXU3_9PROT|nr:plasmid pRiA4b ORF-3 family protein [Nitrosomonas ureae]PTQ88792.1 pRiA4b ORF-3-like protein [Nitrosomonas ureae]
MEAKSLRSIYQLKITLKGMRPPIWRRILMASTTKLDDVHLIFQIVMGWTNSHMHEFIQGRDRYVEPDEEFSSDAKDEAQYRLDQLLEKEKEKLIYIYDFGDGWEHEVVLEKILPFKTSADLPICVKGCRACPPEDIGGIGGYMMFLEAISDPTHPEHEDMLEWIAGDIEGPFDPEAFDLAEVNQLLQS